MTRIVAVVLRVPNQSEIKKRKPEYFAQLILSKSKIPRAGDFSQH